jgi:hypothetical protein
MYKDHRHKLFNWRELMTLGWMSWNLNLLQQFYTIQMINWWLYTGLYIGKV